jgi:hypothetical protein
MKLKEYLNELDTSLIMNFPKWVDTDKGMSLVHFCLRADTALTLESVVEKYRTTAKQVYS